MFIPFISKRLEKRKGGGGGRGGGGSTSSSGSSSGSSGGKSSSSGGTSSSPKSSSSFKPNVGGSTRSTHVYGNGSKKVIVIPAGQAFAGRSAGGATRSQVYGTPYYGSGYPMYVPVGAAHHGVLGRGFPFFFWPIVWGTTAGFGAAYLWSSIAEYGHPDNGTRPGGPEVMLMIQSPTKTQTYHLIADRDTATAMIAPLESSCSSIGNKPLAVAPFNGAADQPKPEQAVQYYRSSSVVLTLQGYNNSVVFTEGDNSDKPADPLPAGIDTTFLSCLNTTIGAAVPLVDASITTQTHAFWMLSVALLVAFRNAL